MPIPRESASTSDHKARVRLEHLLATMEEVWNRGDAEGYANLFMEDAVSVMRGGAMWERREEIRRQQAAAFSGPLRYTILHFRAWNIRFITSKVAMVYAAMEIEHPWNRSNNTQVLASLVCAVVFDDWRIASAHHTDMA